eukprot:6208368-Pleurochrysis_carterae.AAC.1
MDRPCTICTFVAGSVPGVARARLHTGRVCSGKGVCNASRAAHSLLATWEGVGGLPWELETKSIVARAPRAAC